MGDNEQFHLHFPWRFSAERKGLLDLVSGLELKLRTFLQELCRLQLYDHNDLSVIVNRSVTEEQ